MSDTKPPAKFIRHVPEGDTFERDVCATCGFINYENPKVVVGSVVHHQDRVLLCRRAIEPRTGFWTIPAGYMEIGETAAQGAIREAQEEACADIVIENVLAIYSIPRIGQVQVIHVAHLAKPEFACGAESLDVALFEWDEIPWDHLAFPSVHWALQHFREIRGKAEFAVFSNPPGETGAMTSSSGKSSIGQ